MNGMSVEADGRCLSTFTQVDKLEHRSIFLFLLLFLISFNRRTALDIKVKRSTKMENKTVESFTGVCCCGVSRSPVWSHLRQNNCAPTQLVWNCVRPGARATAALLACVRGIERDPCLGEWVGLRREAHADLMCV